jgi:hypothetical protein
MRIAVVDIAPSATDDEEIIYANVNATGTLPNFDELPWLLAPQSLNQNWSKRMRCVAPPSKAERSLDIFTVARPAALDKALSCAIEAVQLFERGKLDIACVMLGAALEATLRPVVEKAYRARSVTPDGNALDGLGRLVEAARLLLDPTLHPALVGDIRKLAKTGRNPAAHGVGASLDEGTVAEWMVDFATVYEWARIAQPIGTAGG